MSAGQFVSLVEILGALDEPELRNLHGKSCPGAHGLAVQNAHLLRVRVPLFYRGVQAASHASWFTSLVDHAAFFDPTLIIARTKFKAFTTLLVSCMCSHRRPDGSAQRLKKRNRRGTSSALTLVAEQSRAGDGGGGWCTVV